MAVTQKGGIGSSLIESVYQADKFYYPTINELPVETADSVLISRYIIRDYHAFH
jgi:hypothetical protein